MRVKKCSNSSTKSSVDAFVEEALVRRELSDNFCFYNSKYDQIGGALPWAQETLAVHANDKRDYLYAEEVLEKGQTHDDLWNAAQVRYVCQRMDLNMYLKSFESWHALVGAIVYKNNVCAGELFSSVSWTGHMVVHVTSGAAGFFVRW